MIRLWAVIERDLKKFFRNPIVLGMSILLPLIYLVILGSSFQGKLRGLPLVIVNQDQGPAARQLLDNLRAVAAGPQTLRLIIAYQEGDAVADVRRGRYKACLIIPSDFSKRAALRGIPEVALFLDNTDSISAETIRSAVAGALQSLQSLPVDYVPVREKPGAMQLRDIALYQQIDYRQSLVPGVVIMSIFLGSLTTGAFNLVMDRFLGLDESYMLTPLTKGDIVAGLIVSGLMITTAIAVLILVISMLITGLSFAKTWSHFASLLLIIVLTTLSLSSLMFVLLVRFRHPRVVGILSGFMNVILFFPSGAVYPIASFPGWLQTFANVNPESYAVAAFKAVLFKDAAPATLWPNLVFLLAFTVVMMVTAIVTFKRTL
jgi:ABC-2 type transport system permease protein